MEKRLTILETKLEAVLPNLATKEDIHKLESGFVKWGVGIALGVVGLLVGYLSLSKPAPQGGVQPIIVQIPASAAQFPPVAPPAKPAP